MAGLTEQELGLLMIHVNGGNVAAIGHWEKPCDHLVELGLLRRLDKHNHEITSAGREAAEKEETDSLRAMIDANNRLLARKFSRPHPVGPALVQGKLFFGFPDGSSISCECIGEPFASRIVELWKHRDG